MEVTRESDLLWHKIEFGIKKVVPSHVKNAFL